MYHKIMLHLMSLLVMNKVIFHLDTSYLDSINELGYDYTIKDNEIDVTLPHIKYNSNHSLIDPNEQLCDHYFIDYDYVNLIEVV